MRLQHVRRTALVPCACLLALGTVTLPSAHAATAHRRVAENDRVAPDTRIPVPSTSVGDREKRLEEKGMSAGSPAMIRIFKAESELELWLQKGERFELFATYPICFWSGKLGPKLREGDRQAPEGLYSVGPGQLHHRGRWPRAFDIGYPNALDRAAARTGSYILVHGGCTSTGCYAMTNPVMDEIYALGQQALQQGQDRIQVHVFPFRMTDAKLAEHGDSPWQSFWHNLKDAYDLFERTRLPPKVGICGARYVVGEGTLPSNDEPKSEADAPTPPSMLCEETAGSPTPVLSTDVDDDAGPQVRKERKASRRHARRHAGRNARKAYGAARRARMAAHARRADAGEPRPSSQAFSQSYGQPAQ